MKWSFPSNNNSDIIGISGSGFEFFQGTPLRSLAREICQNSLDAGLEGETVKVEFCPFGIFGEEFPDAVSLKEAFDAAHEFWSAQKSKKTVEFLKRAQTMIKSNPVPFLRISDFNTTGLKGSREEYNTPWTNLTKSSGASDKAGVSGGSFGVGKFAPFVCSAFRTVFYSTVDENGLQAFQGIARLTSFKREQDNEITLGVGYYGGENHRPLHVQKSLDQSFKRDENQTGTDIFVSGFRFFSDWKSEMIASILDGFFYAVYSGKLAVLVDDVLIDSKTLPSLLNEYQEFLAENADKYYTVLTSENTVWHEINYKNHGCVKLGLIIQKGMHRKVAMIRKTGMKIMDRGHISGIIPFAGVMLIEGEKVNSFLRNLENPTHTKWEHQRMEPEQVPFARAYVKGLVDYIKDCLEKLQQKDDTDEIDSDVGEYLPDEGDAEGEKTKAEAVSDTIESFEVSRPPIKTDRNIVDKHTGDIAANDETGDFAEDESGSGTGGEEENKSSGGSGLGDQPGDGWGPNPKEKNKAMVHLKLSKARVFCLCKEAGEYSIMFVPQESAETGFLDIFLVAESHVYEAPIISATGLGSVPLETTGNRVSGLTFSENTPVRLKIKVDYQDYCSLEVRAYGNKT